MIISYHLNPQELAPGWTSYGYDTAVCSECRDTGEFSLYVPFHHLQALSNMMLTCSDGDIYTVDELISMMRQPNKIIWTLDEIKHKILQQSFYDSCTNGNPLSLDALLDEADALFPVEKLVKEYLKEKNIEIRY